MLARRTHPGAVPAQTTIQRATGKCEQSSAASHWCRYEWVVRQESILPSARHCEYTKKKGQSMAEYTHLRGAWAQEGFFFLFSFYISVVRSAGHFQRPGTQELDFWPAYVWRNVKWFTTCRSCTLSPGVPINFFLIAEISSKPAQEHYRTARERIVAQRRSTISNLTGSSILPNLRKRHTWWSAPQQLDDFILYNWDGSSLTFPRWFSTQGMGFDFLFLDGFAVCISGVFPDFSFFFFSLFCASIFQAIRCCFDFYDLLCSDDFLRFVRDFQNWILNLIRGYGILAGPGIRYPSRNRLNGMNGAVGWNGGSLLQLSQHQRHHGTTEYLEYHLRAYCNSILQRRFSSELDSAFTPVKKKNSIHRNRLDARSRDAA